MGTEKCASHARKPFVPPESPPNAAASARDIARASLGRSSPFGRPAKLALDHFLFLG